MARRTFIGANCLTLLLALAAGRAGFAQSGYPPPGAYPTPPATQASAIDPRSGTWNSYPGGAWGTTPTPQVASPQATQVWSGPGGYNSPTANSGPTTSVHPAVPPAMDGYTPYHGPADRTPAAAAASLWSNHSTTSAAPPQVSAPYGLPNPAPYSPPAGAAGYAGPRPSAFGPPPPPAPLAAPHVAGLPSPGVASPTAPPMGAMPPGPASQTGALAAPQPVSAPGVGSAESSAPSAAPSSTGSPPVVGELFEPAQVVAVVGDERILAGDIMAQVNQFIEQNRDKIPPGREEYYRKRLMEQVLESEIQSKLVYLDFLRHIRAKGAGPEKITEIHNRVYEQFDEKRLPDLMERAKVASPAELDAKLREQGSSLMKHKRQFAEKVMSQQWIRDTDKVNYNPIITHAQMLDYYYEHLEDYSFPARARWEHLMARWDKFPNKAAAYEAIRAMGNEVYLGGAPLWAVAKRSSHGVTASDGGQFDWTTQGSLKSKVLDKAIFELPLNQLSPILEDEEGLHIVRVLERQEAGRTPFETAQAEIKEKLKKQMVQKQVDAFLADLRKNTPVWTIFDEEKKKRAEEEAARVSTFGERTR